MLDPAVIQAIIGMEPDSGQHRLAIEALAVSHGLEVPATPLVPFVKRKVMRKWRVFRIADVSRRWPSLPGVRR